MSATTSNANLRTSKTGNPAGPTEATGFPPRAASHAPGREALQALLAFSSLHDQIRRQRRVKSGGAGAIEPQRMERFVPDEVLQLISERALAITGADGVAIALADGEEVRCRAAAGEKSPDVGARLDPNSGFSGACFRTGLIVRCDDSEKDPRVDREACRRIGVRSMVAVPLLTEQGVLGLVAAFCRDPHGVSDADIRSLSLLAELALEALTSGGPSSEPAVASDAEMPPVQDDEEPASPDAARGTLPNVESLRDTLFPVTEARVAEENQAANNAPVPASKDFLQYPPQSGTSHSKRALIITLILVCLAAALGGAGLWWWRSKKAAAAGPHEKAAAPIVNTPPAVPPAETANPPAAEATKNSQYAQVTAIRHWASDDSTTVAIDLQQEVQYEAHRLSDPQRIYFDLRDTNLGPGIPGTIEVGDAFLSRVRVAQPTPGLTRVVLETKDNPDFSVKLDTNPYRLLIEIRSATAKPKNSAKVDLFAPQDTTRRASATPERGIWLAPAQTAASAESAALATHGNAFRIVLDAGHGGWDMGTVGKKGLLEKDLVLDIVARVGMLVQKQLGAEVIYTRSDDSYISLERRTEIANTAQADMFLSVHANYSSSPNARGVETYYTNTYSLARAGTSDSGNPQVMNVDWLNVDLRNKVQESERFADDVQQSLYHTLRAKNPGLRNRGVKEASYVVLTGTTMPAILAEVSFVSSPEDESKLEQASYRQQIAQALYKGIAAYAESVHRVNMASAASATGGQ